MRSRTILSAVLEAVIAGLVAVIVLLGGYAGPDANAEATPPETRARPRRRPMGSHERARTDRDPAAGLRQAANIQRRQFEIMLDVILVFQEAARTDPDIAAATHRILANRERGFRTHLEAIKSHLAPGVSVDDAVALYCTLVLPEVYRSLVVERGWSPEKYEEWLGSALIHSLLRAVTG